MLAFIQSILTQFGVFALFVVLSMPVVKWLAEKVIVRLIDAKIDEGVRSRLATIQFEFDKQLAGFHGELDREAERLRSLLSREASEYSIWAQRRHYATVTLFADFLRCELKATDLTSYHFQPTERVSDQELAAVIARYPELLSTQKEISQLRAESQHDRVDAILEHHITAARNSHLIAARNEAQEAYYRAALYLSDPVDTAARSVRDQFHAILVPYIAGTNRGSEFFENKTKLRFLMLELMNRARSDLGRAANAGSTSGLPVGAG